MIVAVDGTPVETADQVRPLIVAKAPGETVEFTVERAGGRETVDVRLGQAAEAPEAAKGEERVVDPDAGSGYAGIVTQTDRRHELPVDVTIDTARVSGPSAGLAFSLAIIDDLTEGDLTGRGDVAVTGTIDEDGSVGSGRRRRPEGRDRPARPAPGSCWSRPTRSRTPGPDAGDMKVVGVRTLDDALAALAKAGGSGVAAIATPPGAAQ